MQNSKYVPPEYGLESFNCPHCDAYSHQQWSHLLGYSINNANLDRYRPNSRVALCVKCEDFSLWVNGEMYFPVGSTAPLPNADLPEKTRLIYEEARTIMQTSPRAAAALLRLCIQEICVSLGEKGKNLNNDIGKLVKKGLPSEVQQAMDVIRFNGNKCIHPGEIDLSDDNKIAVRLFGLVNLIADRMITGPMELKELYEGISEEAMEQIEKRDEKK